MYLKIYLKPNNFLIAIFANPLGNIVGIWTGVRYIRWLKLADVTQGKRLYLNPNYLGHFWIFGDVGILVSYPQRKIVYIKPLLE